MKKLTLGIIAVLGMSFASNASAIDGPGKGIKKQMKSEFRSQVMNNHKSIISTTVKKKRVHVEKLPVDRIPAQNFKK